jgi:predicted MFS family arabinose efflux permease
VTRGSALALVGLSLAAFAFVTTETLPIGLLPQIALSLGTSIPLTGALVTAYAFTVAVSAVPATALTARLTRRRLLLLLLGALLATNIAAALASSYAMLFAARIVNAIAHAIFWSIAGSCAVRLVPERQRGLALAIVFSGVSLATVAGVPAATFLGQHFGWHVAFGAVAATAAILLVVICLSVNDASTAAAEPGAAFVLLQNGAFRSLLATTVLVVLGQFVAYTYIVPFVVHVDGLPAESAAALLFLFGLMGALGNIGAGMLANRSPRAASLATTAIIASALLMLCLADDNRLLAVIAIGVWGLGAGGLAVGLQTRVLALAPKAPDLASALFAASFNLGIGGGALLGGIIFETFGLARTAPVGAALALVALIVQAASAQSSVRRRRRDAHAA